jgi:hypothetical protein
LSVEQRLRTKIDCAARSVGISGSILPASLARAPVGSEPQSAAGPAPPRPEATSPAQCAALARSIVARWRATADTLDTVRTGDRERTVSAAATADVDGILAAALIGDVPVLVASLGGPITDRAPVVARAVALVDAGREVTNEDATAIVRARDAVVAWGERRLARRDAGLADGAVASERRRILGRIAAIARRTPPHTRGHVARLAEGARAAALAAGGIGAEQSLGLLARDVERSDDAWLRMVAASRTALTAADDATGVHVRVLILLRRAWPLP